MSAGRRTGNFPLYRGYERGGSLEVFRRGEDRPCFKINVGRGSTRARLANFEHARQLVVNLNAKGNSWS